MAKWITLLLALMATALIFISTSAAPSTKPLRLSCTEVPGTGSADTSLSDKPKKLNKEPPKYSVQILLVRASTKDYHWMLAQGPAKIPVNPCPTYPKPFEVISMSSLISYAPDAIENPPGPPVMSLDMDPWDGRKNCKWTTTGGDDVGMVECDEYASGCTKDGQYKDGVINCHGVSFHRMFACEF
ncbi:hypothetical protein PTTW11_02730 [Pyrenophora teres f. teres]|uniref:Uncharacterized protein n=1 Tax=Pyrenophora teres f. teres TaxID=97479 RepID=A0A6S6VFA5_9PLEO|nr:hypothetical protein PTNB29_01198 [Pyrenophora teres f. teres]CAE7014975.1 hypothetical protein PTTW11_02730 [Pyrenophora teres f. teres]